LLHVLGSLVPTPEDGLRRITTPTLVVIGDRDERSDADELAALLPAGVTSACPEATGTRSQRLSSPPRSRHSSPIGPLPKA
jgi:pimeloyl-ACP methyl ester carboxylesterase